MGPRTDGNSGDELILEVVYSRSPWHLRTPANIPVRIRLSLQSTGWIGLWVVDQLVLDRPMREITCGASNAFEQTFAVQTEPTHANEPAASISLVIDGQDAISARMFSYSGFEVGSLDGSGWYY